jgi:ABC-type transporter Mla MlaB component
MLRISNNSETEEARLRLDGNVTGPWVKELEASCEAALSGGKRLRIDLGGVGFVDEAGITLMHGLKAKGVDLVNCSPFIKLQLGLNGEFFRET